MRASLRIGSLILGCMYLVFDDESMRVSHQTIYRSLFMQARGVLKKGADGPSAVEAAHAPLAPCQRPRTITGADRRCPLDPGKARAIPGHGEGDLLSGAKHSYIATQVERHSRFVILIKLPSRDTAVVLAGLLKHIRKLPATLRRSLTWDRGLEMAKPQGLYGSHRCEGLRLRSAESPATRHERKRQPTAAAILPARHRPVPHFSSAARSGLAARAPEARVRLRL